MFFIFYKILFSLCCHSLKRKDLLHKINLYFTLQLCPAHCTLFHHFIPRDPVEPLNRLYVQARRRSSLTFHSSFSISRGVGVAFHPILFYRKADHVGYRNDKNIARQIGVEGNQRYLWGRTEHFSSSPPPSLRQQARPSL